MKIPCNKSALVSAVVLASAAGSQLTLAQERYRLGAAAYLELLEAQNSMAEAERDYLNAQYRFHGAIWALEAAVGERLRPGAANAR